MEQAQKIFGWLVGRTPTGAAVRLGMLGLVCVYWGFTFVHLRGGFNPFAGLILLWTDSALWRDFVTDFYANGGSELLSITVTVVIIERLNRARDKHEREETQKALDKRLDEQELARLKALLGSNESVVTKIAIAELRAKGWLTDGSLKRTNLREANLEKTNLDYASLIKTNLSLANLRGAYLRETNLEDAYLGRANFEGANLQETNLERARLDEANLERTELYKANLKGSSLKEANLEGSELGFTILERVRLDGANLERTYLYKANLKGSNLKGANLQEAYLNDVIFDEEILLPDGTFWSEDVDMEKFTNPEHPEFVRYETIWDEE